ncbi:ExeA family protein [Vibrio sp.]|uniref:ExeA family protein n=1 Tax=Vibrio sp. TaxID=678 RepID=UPI003D0C0966
MYQEYFGFHQRPFHLTPDTALFLGLAPHFEALKTVQAALQMGEGLVKVVGEVGTGKTMVCRMLFGQLEGQYQLVYLPNSALSGQELRLAVARELGISAQSDSVALVDEIQQQLIRSCQQGLPVVILVDEAQALSDEALEVLRLFGNLETEQQKLLQIVLFGQPELDKRLAQHHLRQFRQRITFSAKLRPLKLDESVAYIDNRLQQSGGSTSLFSLNQKRALWRASQGIPRLINQICHKALLLAMEAGKIKVSNAHLYEAIHDTFDSQKPKFKSPYLWGWSSQ